MFSAILKCKQCGAQIVVSAETEALLHMKATKRRYCSACMEKRIEDSRKASYKKRHNRMEELVQINMREFNEGYERFWKKRGMQPPKVDVWGNVYIEQI